MYKYCNEGCVETRQSSEHMTTVLRIDLGSLITDYTDSAYISLSPSPHIHTCIQTGLTGPVRGVGGPSPQAIAPQDVHAGQSTNVSRFVLGPTIELTHSLSPFPVGGPTTTTYLLLACPILTCPPMMGREGPPPGMPPPGMGGPPGMPPSMRGELVSTHRSALLSWPTHMIL